MTGKRILNGGILREVTVACEVTLWIPDLCRDDEYPAPHPTIIAVVQAFFDFTASRFARSASAQDLSAAQCLGLGTDKETRVQRQWLVSGFGILLGVACRFS